ncbi:hypothetical protein FGRMN_3863 [Fusarium graminum]|nr:hypothetical protein FGRMN_3863 [Fusarium graminum]
MPRARVKDIQLITQLRVTLGYGVTGDRKSIYFNQTVSNFRKDYRSADGIPGSCFADWHNLDHRRELERMADKFLVTDRRGPQFWPDVEIPSSRSSLTWTTHRNRIRSIIVKLFFRLNYKPQQRANRSADTSSRRSQTLEQGFPAEVPETRTENIDRNETRDIQDDQHIDTEVLPRRPGIPDQYSPPSSPFSPSGHPTSSDSDDIHEEQHQSLVPEPTGVGEPAAPVAQMTVTQEMPVTPRRPVERQDFVATPDFSALDNARSRLSLDIGTPSTRVTPSEDPDDTHPIFAPRGPELPRPSIETVASPAEADGARRAMPPPPLPLTRPTETLAAQRRGMSWDDLVPKDDDLAFQDMKGRFKEKIRDDLDEIGDRRDVVYYDIVIIPLRASEASPEAIREQTVAL